MEFKDSGNGSTIYKLEDPELDRNDKIIDVMQLTTYLFICGSEKRRIRVRKRKEAEGDEYLFLFSGKNNVLLPCPKIITSTIIIS